MNLNQKAKENRTEISVDRNICLCCLYFFIGKWTENVRQKPSGGRERFTKHQGSGEDFGSTGGNCPVPQGSCDRGDDKGTPVIIYSSQTTFHQEESLKFLFVKSPIWCHSGFLVKDVFS